MQRHLVGLLSSVLLACGPAAAQSQPESPAPTPPQPPTRAQMAELSRLAAGPRLPGGRLRYENITDLEVKELQAAVAKVQPGALINIGSVFEGCSCEEGPACTDQVWVVAHQPGHDAGVSLAKVDGHWVLSRVYDWSARYQVFRDKYYSVLHTHGGSTQQARDEYYQSLQSLLAEMPQCTAKATDTATANALR